MPRRNLRYSHRGILLTYISIFIFFNMIGGSDLPQLEVDDVAESPLAESAAAEDEPAPSELLVEPVLSPVSSDDCARRAVRSLTTMPSRWTRATGRSLPFVAPVRATRGEATVKATRKASTKVLIIAKDCMLSEWY